jgi:hypothetical protein
MYEAYAAGVISDAPTVAQVLRNVLMFVLSIAGVVSLISFIVSGIFYLVSGGSSEQLERAKRAFAFGVVGTVISLSGLIFFFAIAAILEG